MLFVAFEALALGKPELASDVFATCATLFFLREGHHPFGDDVREMLKRMDRDEPDRQTGRAELAAVIAAGLARAPARRPSAAELASTFADCFEHQKRREEDEICDRAFAGR